LRNTVALTLLPHRLAEGRQKFFAWLHSITDALKGVGFRYFGYGEALAAFLGRKADFCSRLNK